MTNLQTQILNHKWKKCKGCSGTGEQLGLFAKYSTGMLCNMQTCEECKGSSFEPMEIENPLCKHSIKEDGCKKRSGVGEHYKYKEGKIIKIKREIGVYSDKQETMINHTYYAKSKIIKTDNKTGWGIVPC